MDYRKHRTQPLFTLVFLLHHYAVWSHRRPTADKYRKPFFHRPTAVGCPIDCHRLLQLKIYILHSASPIYNVQLCIPILLTLFSIYMFRLFERLSNIGTKKTAAIVNYIASLTLDIYIVQFVIMDYFTRYTFPFGYFGSIAAILLTAGILNYISKYATSFLRNSLSKLII